MRLKAAAGVSLIVSLSASCGRSESRADYSVRDSAGVAIAENAAPAWTAEEAWSVAESPHLEIGASERPGHDLYEVSGVVRFADGRIAVANSGSREVRIFSDEAELVETLGGPGEGPGEFRSLTRIFLLPGDSLLVTDFRLDRLTVFSSAGDLVRTAQIAAPPSGGVPSPAARLRDGSLMARPGFSFSGGTPTGVGQDTTPVMRYGADGSYLGDLGRVPGPEYFVYSEGGNTLGGERTWGRKTHLAAAGDGFIVGRSADFSYEVHGGAGELLRIVRARRPARAVTETDIARLKEPSPRDDPASAALWKRVLDAIELPTHFPAYAGILAEEDGHVWIREYVWPAGDTARQEWQVFDPEGRWLGAVTMPAAFAALRIEPEEVLGIYRDAMDVEHLQAYRLNRRPR